MEKKFPYIGQEYTLRECGKGKWQVINKHEHSATISEESTGIYRVICDDDWKDADYFLDARDIACEMLIEKTLSLRLN